MYYMKIAIKLTTQKSQEEQSHPSDLLEDRTFGVLLHIQFVYSGYLHLSRLKTTLVNYEITVDVGIPLDFSVNEVCIVPLGK